MTDAHESRGHPSSLVEAAASGSHEAFARIMATHDGDMTRICMVICGNVDAAREAVQAAWPIAWRRLGTIRDPDRLRPWLMSVAANEARQMLRRERRRERGERRLEPPPSPDPAHRADHMDLAAAVARLGSDDRRLLALRYVAGLTSPEIARQLGGRPGSVRSRLARLIARLRKDLGDD